MKTTSSDDVILPTQRIPNGYGMSCESLFLQQNNINAASELYIASLFYGNVSLINCNAMELSYSKLPNLYYVHSLIRSVAAGQIVIG